MDNQPTNQPDPWSAVAAATATADGERYRFFPLGSVTPDGPLQFKVVSNPTIDPAKFQGAHSLVEFDAQVLSAANGLPTGGPYRFAVSGGRLARALSQAKPTIGQIVEVAVQGIGKERTWTAKLV